MAQKDQNTAGARFKFTTYASSSEAANFVVNLSMKKIARYVTILKTMSPKMGLSDRVLTKIALDAFFANPKCGKLRDVVKHSGYYCGGNYDLLIDRLS
jgi:hypothetical protein